MDLDAANSVNKALTELYDKYNLNRLEYLNDYPIDNSSADVINSGVKIGNSDALRVMFPKSIDRQDEHSAFYFDDAIDSMIRHEMGHLLPDQIQADILKLFSQGIAYDMWKQKFRVTVRSVDNIFECMAENFVFFSKGMTDMINRERLKEITVAKC